MCMPQPAHVGLWQEGQVTWRHMLAGWELGCERGVMWDGWKQGAWSADPHQLALSAAVSDRTWARARDMGTTVAPCSLCGGGRVLWRAPEKTVHRSDARLGRPPRATECVCEGEKE